MNEIGVVSPEQMRQLWQDYLSRQQLNPQVSQNYPRRMPIDEVSPHRAFVKNASGETCPAYGCLQITGVEIVGGRTVITIDKPSDLTGEYLFNSQFSIAAGACGWAYRFGIVIAIGDAPATPNTVYQPMVGQWTIEEGGDLFTVFGEHNAAANGLIGRFNGGGGSSQNHLHGIVVYSWGCGYYDIQLAEWAGTTPDAQSSAPSASSSPDECDICDELIDGSGGACAEDQTLPAYEETETEETPHIVRRQVVGLVDDEDRPIIVLARHRASQFVPLQLYSDCLLADLGDENETIGSASGSGSASSGTTEPVYQIVDGIMEHLLQYRERWECCNGVDTLMGRTPIIFPGKECAEEVCTTCE